MMRKIVGIGEAILDIIFQNDQPHAAVPGGSTGFTEPAGDSGHFHKRSGKRPCG